MTLALDGRAWPTVELGPRSVGARGIGEGGEPVPGIVVAYSLPSMTERLQSHPQSRQKLQPPRLSFGSVGWVVHPGCGQVPESILRRGPAGSNIGSMLAERPQRDAGRALE